VWFSDNILALISSHGIDIPAQNTGETHDRGKFGVDGIVDPFIQRIWISAAQESVEAHGQGSHLSECF
jgi:hypothetical protein